MNAARGCGHEGLNVQKGIEALRAWFFLSVERTDDPDNVISPFPPFPEVELLNEMDAPPAGFAEPPPGAMSVFDFYASFTRDADQSEKDDWMGIDRQVLRRIAPAAYARENLQLRPEFKTKPHINVGVRFLFHLAHALKTLPRPGPVRMDEDPCVSVEMPLDCGQLLHMFPPTLVSNPSDAHKAVWADPKTGTYDKVAFMCNLNRDFNLSQCVHIAFPTATLIVICPACNCDSKLTENMGEAVASIEAYSKTLAKFCCPHCGLWFSCLNPSVKNAFGGIRRKDEPPETSGKPGKPGKPGKSRKSGKSRK